jgi:DNA-binding NarL/FixJ family response regulator
VNGSPAPIRLLLVEDNEVYRESLVFLLRRHAELEVAAAVPDGAAAIRSWKQSRPDVTVLDLRLPDVDGAEVAAELRALAADAAVVFLSASAGDAEYDAASGAGAALVRKDSGIEALIDAVRAAAGR